MIGHFRARISGGSALVLTALFLFKADPATAAPTEVWIDTDLSLGAPFAEVDDAYALLLALHSPELRVVGLSTTFGNASLATTTRRTRTFLRRLGLTNIVFPGSASPGELGKASRASDALSETLHRRKITYLALGPLTNLASFLQLHPQQAGRIERVVMVMGRSPRATLGFGPRDRFRIHDANFVKDPVAAERVLVTTIPLLLAPIEVSSRLMLNSKDLERLRASGDGGRILAQESGLWLWFWQRLVRSPGGPIFDALAVVAAADPRLVRTERREATIEGQAGLIVRPKAQSHGRAVDFCRDVSRATKGFILQRLTQP